MAGYDNIKDYGFDKLTAEEQREIASKGGKASVKARRKRKHIRDNLDMLLSCGILDENTKKTLKLLGIEDEEDLNYQTLVNYSMINQAIKGNVKAYYAINEVLGESARYQKQEDNINKDTNKLSGILKQLRGKKND